MRPRYLNDGLIEATDEVTRLRAENATLRGASGFCRACGAGTPPKAGEGTCPVCDPVGVELNTLRHKYASAVRTLQDIAAMGKTKGSESAKHRLAQLGESQLPEVAE